MPTLYYAPNACSLAPHIALEWIGAPYEAVRVQYGSEELLSINPAGAVPTFREDDGWLLTQAGAILDYLANKHPEAGLSGGESMRAQAEARRWSAFFIGRPRFILANLCSQAVLDRRQQEGSIVRDRGRAGTGVETVSDTRSPS